MDSIKRGPTITRTAITHYGEWNEESRKVPALNFFEKYDDIVLACDFSGAFHDCKECDGRDILSFFDRDLSKQVLTYITSGYASNAQFYFNNGTNLHSGAEIWEVMKSPALFGKYEKLVAENRITTVIVGGHEKGDRLIHQQDMVFFLREGNLKEVGIPVRRTIEFVCGPSEVEGQGTDGLQFYIGKTFWDTGVLSRELARRAEL